MKLHIIRINSVVPGGVGGPEAGALDLIYSFLLQEYKCDYYSHILINQIGEDLEELIWKDRGNLHINIRYPVDDFENKNLKQKNLYRLEVVHAALTRIAEEYGNLDIASLEMIKNRIIQQDFQFDLVYREFVSKKYNLTGKIIIHPLNDRFCYYFLAERNSELLCKVLVYEGKCTIFYVRDIFHAGKWETANEFVIMDKNKETETHIFIDQQTFKLVNLTRYKNPPFYEMMKAGPRNDGTYKDWLHSLPPGAAGAISFEPN